MGGLDKTTLSKALFNDIRSRFEASSFVFDVRVSEQQFNGLTNLQRQILMDLRGEDIKLNRVPHDKSQMRRRLGSKRALVILEDVDNHKEIDALGRSDWFGGGSRIIVTTRNQLVLNVGHADEDYEMEGLEFGQALELFSWPAFLRVCLDMDLSDLSVCPHMDLSDLSQRVANACKGLPLSLETIALKISYDGLNYEEQQIFLEIGCFFFRQRKIVNGCWNASTAIKNLSLKSLIRVDKDDCFAMHDHMRDLGRRIVTEESPEKPDKRSRLWHPHDVCPVMKHKEGTTRVRGLLYSAWDHDPRSDPKWSTESLVVMTNLQFLSLHRIYIEGKMEE
eukprot:Gb_00097 [translate_table: standard]